MLADPLPVVRSARRGRVPRTAARRVCRIRRPRGALRRTSGATTCSCGTTRMATSRAMGACSRAAGVVRRRPRHVDGRDPRRVRMRRPGTGGDAIDRSRALSFTFDDRELSGRSEGDTLASALARERRMDVVCRSPIRSDRAACTRRAQEEPTRVRPVVGAPFVEPGGRRDGPFDPESTGSSRTACPAWARLRPRAMPSRSQRTPPRPRRDRW